MIRLFRPLTIVIFMLVMPSWAEAQLVLPQVFGDHMVLQRDQNVRFWGWAAPNEQVSVEVDGFSVTTKTSPEGKWGGSLPFSCSRRALYCSGEGIHSDRADRCVVW